MPVTVFSILQSGTAGVSTLRSKDPRTKIGPRYKLNKGGPGRNLKIREI